MKNIIIICLIYGVSSCAIFQRKQQSVPQMLKPEAIDTIAYADFNLYPSSQVIFRRLPNLTNSDLYVVEVPSITPTVPNITINAKKASGSVNVTLVEGQGNTVQEAPVMGKNKSKTDRSTIIEQPNSGINISWKVAVPVALFMIGLGFLSWKLKWFR